MGLIVHPILLSNAFVGFRLSLLQVQVPFTALGRRRRALPDDWHVCPTICKTQVNIKLLRKANLGRWTSGGRRAGALWAVGDGRDGQTPHLAGE